MREPHDRKRGLSRADAEEIGVSAFVWLAADAERLSRFMALTGLEPDQLRAAAAAPDFLPAVLDHLAGHEPDLVAFAGEHRLPPERIAQASQILKQA
ncbi:MAG: DUF3572 domain-containing protein [Hyphomicrobiales bacterium]|nr:DUF3572 domain-containing protein [Hyphomicrobiales bacterium]